MELVDSLPDISFNASSVGGSNNECHAENARISTEGYFNAWCASSTSDTNDYLQIEFFESKQIISCTIYGRPLNNQYVTSYYFEYSVDGVNFTNAYNENNIDGDSKQEHKKKMFAFKSGVI